MGNVVYLFSIDRIGYILFNACFSFNSDSNNALTPCVNSSIQDTPSVNIKMTVSLQAKRYDKVLLYYTRNKQIIVMASPGLQRKVEIH